MVMKLKKETKKKIKLRRINHLPMKKVNRMEQIKNNKNSIKRTIKINKIKKINHKMKRMNMYLKSKRKGKSPFIK